MARRDFLVIYTKTMQRLSKVVASRQRKRGSNADLSIELAALRTHERKDNLS